MKLDRLAIAAVLLAGVIGALLWSNRAEKAKEGKPAPDAPPKILSIAPDTVREIVIKRRNGDTTAVKFEDTGKWQITQPQPLPADSVAVAGITSTASNLTADRLVDSNTTDWASYGLAPAAVEVDFTTKDGKTTKLLVGDNNPTDSDVYARLDGDPRLFTISSFNKTAFDKDSKDLRDKHMLTFIQDKLSRIEVAPSKQESFEFGKVNDMDWQILKPKTMRADNSQVDDLISKLKSASMDLSLSSEDAKKAATAFTSAPLTATVKVTDPNGTQTLEVRKEKDDYYAKSSAVNGVFKIGKDVGDAVAKQVDDYRNKKLFDFGFSDPTRVEVTDTGKTTVYEKSGDKWTSGGKTVDSTKMQTLIDRLRDLNASKFDNTGFTTPIVSFTVVSDNGKRTEKVEFSQASTGSFLGRRQNDSTLYEIEAATMNDVRKAASDIQTSPPEKKK